MRFSLFQETPYFDVQCKELAERADALCLHWARGFSQRFTLFFTSRVYLYHEEARVSSSEPRDADPVLVLHCLSRLFAVWHVVRGMMRWEQKIGRIVYLRFSVDIPSHHHTATFVSGTSCVICWYSALREGVQPPRNALCIQN